MQHVDIRHGQDAEQSQICTCLFSLEYHRDHRLSLSMNILCWNFTGKFLVQFKVKEKNTPATRNTELFDSRSLSVILHRSGSVVHVNSTCHQ